MVFTLKQFRLKEGSVAGNKRSLCGFTAGKICDGSRNFKYSNKDLLYATYEYPEFVSAVTIR